MEKIKSGVVQVGVPIAIGVGGILSMSLIAFFLDKDILSLWTISPYKMVNFTFTMQMLVLLVSFFALLLMYVFDRKKFKAFFRAGFGSNNNWKIYGPVMLVAFTVGNALLMSFSVSAQNGTINNTFFSLLPLVILFSATNAWSEEIFTRFVIVAGLDGRLKPAIICWISAIIFGIPHFWGTPGSFFGVIMTAILGWLLARSVIETKGLGWAILIHFLLDIVIFGAGAMIIAGQ
jgi:uncharacterized protein